jgi:hypothetical protein
MLHTIRALSTILRSRNLNFSGAGFIQVAINGGLPFRMTKLKIFKTGSNNSAITYVTTKEKEKNCDGLELIHRNA